MVCVSEVDYGLNSPFLIAVLSHRPFRPIPFRPSFIHASTPFSTSHTIPLYCIGVLASCDTCPFSVCATGA